MRIVRWHDESACSLIWLTSTIMVSQAAGNVYLPFVDLMKLEKINGVTYRSIAQPFCPGGTHPRAVGRAYGGHVFAQAAWAAAQTVPKGFVLHVSQ